MKSVCLLLSHMRALPWTNSQRHSRRPPPFSLKLFRSRSEPKGRNESDSDKENKDAASSCMRHAQVRLATMTMTHNTFSGRGRPLETSEVTAAELRH